jgi:transposase, IS5 family
MGDLMRENCSANKQKPRTERISMSLQKAYQMTIIDGVFEAKLNPNHELLILAEKINWSRLSEELEPSYSNIGRNGKPIRMMVGAHILKHMFDMSDEQVAARLCGDVYWMWFCGISQAFSTADWRPMDASTMTYFRKRVGSDGVRKIEEAVRDQLLAEKRIKPKSQFTDTTAMEKNVSYPTDTNLLDKGRKRVLAGLKKLKGLGRRIKIGRTFARKARQALLQIIKLGKGRQERIQKGTFQLAKFAKKILERVPNALKKAKKHKDEKTQKQIEQVQEQIRQDAGLLERVIAQSEARYAGEHLKNKVYSLHEPQVTCIAKGKRGKPNEYGSKVSLSIDKNGFVIAHKEYDSNVGDNTTLEEAVSEWEAATGQIPENLAADRAYHMAEYPEKVRAVERIAIPRTGRTKHPDAEKKYFRRLQRKRASIEPVISHLKQDHRMDRCRYKGFDGDRINVSLAATAWNARKWMKQLTSERRAAVNQ